MSNTTPEGFNAEDWRIDNEGNLVPKEERVTRNWRRQLEEDARKGKEAQARVAELERQIAIRDAGIDASDPLGELFSRAYDGPAEIDAIKTAAARYGLVKTDPAQQQQIDQALTGHQQSMNAASGAQTQTGGVDHKAAMQAIAAKHTGPGSAEAARAELAKYAHDNLGPGVMEQFRRNQGLT